MGTVQSSGSDASDDPARTESASSAPELAPPMPGGAVGLSRGKPRPPVWVLEMRMRRLSWYMLSGAGGLAAILLVGTIKHDHSWSMWVASIGGGLFGAIGAALNLEASVFRRRIEAMNARLELELAIRGIHGPNDLLGMIQANRKQMDAYDAQARAQGSTSHWISMVAMIVGLGIVAAGLWIAVAADQTATKYSAAIVAAVGTATGGYIARTFIRLNSAVQDQVRYYFEQPLVQSYLLTAERAIALMPEEERSNQYRVLMEAALHQAAMVPHRGDSGPKAAPKRRNTKAFRSVKKANAGRAD